VATGDAGDESVDDEVAGERSVVGEPPKATTSAARTAKAAAKPSRPDDGQSNLMPAS
jgi:hypothetical protein